MKVKDIKDRTKKARSLLSSCRLCGNLCGVNRLKNQNGKCNSGKDLMIASYNVHFGEEPPISGNKGSGTIFFTNCSLRCIYCQNYPISQMGNGKVISIQELAEIMIKLQIQGCHNVNFVTPTHFVPQIIEATSYARELGFSLPLVYNTSGYETVEALKLLKGIIDIYLVDMRYSDDQIASDCSSAKNYVKTNREAVKEMFSQVGDLTTDEKGIAICGLIIRHLILPHNLAGSKKTFEFIKEEVSELVWVSLMNQYFPANQAISHPFLNRRTTKQEYTSAQEEFLQSGLLNAWVQG